MSVNSDLKIYRSATEQNPPWALDRLDQTDLPLDGQFSYAGTGKGVTIYIIDSVSVLTSNLL